jgi:tetratricopeptide (TPR) repeat protein
MMRPAPLVRCAALAVACAVLAADAASAHPPVRHEIDALGEALAKEPDRADLLLERARLLRVDRDGAAALADLDRARELAPQNRDVALERGLTLSLLGRDAEAEAELSQFLESGPGAGAAFAERARLRARSGRGAEAIADYTAALELEPRVELYLERGELLEAQGRLEEAAQGYRTGLEATHGALLMRLALIRVETARGRHTEALALVDEQLARAGVKTDWYLRRAEVLAAAGDEAGARRARESALVEANRALEARPTAINLVARARVNLALERIPDARSDLELAIAKSPRFREARALLDELPDRAPTEPPPSP